jgi:hypothetical protein
VTAQPRAGTSTGTGTGQPGRPADGWRAAAPELVIAVILIVTVSIAGYALAGAAASGAVAIGTAVIVLVGLRGMLPPERALAEYEHEKAASHFPASFTGFWRKRAGLADGTKYLAAYDIELRPTLQHLLAARLAERHGISLRDDPDLARKLLCQGKRDDGLWYWVDPARPAAQAAGRLAGQADGRAGNRPGIPPRTLARLIDRLERL